MRAGYFLWLQQKRCNELLHLWGMILPLCHRSFQFSPALAGAFASAAAAFLFSVFGRPVMLLHIRHFNLCSLRKERSTWYLYKMNVATFQFSLPRVRSDPTTKMPHLLPDNFNSRSLRGERWLLFQEVLLSAQFQFSLPAWGAISRNFCCRCSS